MEKELTCIRCPMGCTVEVELDGAEVVSVRGNTCKRGEDYARAEATAPTRTVTSTARVTGGVRPVVAVRTVPEVPKESIFAVMDAIRALTAAAPVKMGDVLAENIAGTGSDLVAADALDTM